MATTTTTAAPHFKSRQSPYQGGPARFAVPDALVPWKAAFDSYLPVLYTAPSVQAQPVWADNPANIRTTIKFNEVDGKLNRVSFEGRYELDPKTGEPLNPRGRTGMIGRGLLGRYGPNHAADPIVSRWQRNDKGEIVVDASGNKVVEFVGIKRKDNGEWAIPGGMVDAGENVSLTLKREFGEEALNSEELTPDERKEAMRHVEQLFANGIDVYRGYVDDPRNTDNAWMETVAVNFHDETGELTKRFKLCAGDDAGAVKWIAATPDVKLYASHTDFIRRVVEIHLRDALNGAGAGVSVGAGAGVGTLPSTAAATTASPTVIPEGKNAAQPSSGRQRAPKRSACVLESDGNESPSKIAAVRRSSRIAAIKSPEK